jgi:hypothetical protein
MTITLDLGPGATQPVQGREPQCSIDRTIGFICYSISAKAELDGLTNGCSRGPMSAAGGS